jgi:hypothetical protein
VQIPPETPCILQGRWQHGEKVVYCYPSGLEKTLCKWEVYVPLVTKGLRQEILLFFERTKPALGSNQSPVHRTQKILSSELRRPTLESDSSLPPNSDISCTSSVTSTTHGVQSNFKLSKLSILTLKHVAFCSIMTSIIFSSVFCPVIFKKPAHASRSFPCFH